MPVSRLHRLGAGLERAVDALRRRLGRSDGYGPLEIVGFRGHGTRDELRVRGRVVEDRRIPASRDDDTLVDNLVAAWRRFETDEVPDVEVRVAARGLETRVRTDEEGYFQARLRGGDPPREAREWESVELVVADDRSRGILGARAAVPVRVPGPRAAFGIVSDVDDTIVHTGATDLLQALRQTVFHNARTRLAFPGVAAFYRALAGGAGGDASNPVFYVSSGPWNLYELLVEFLDLHGIPDGPIFLQDIGLDVGKLGLRSHMDHKMACITDILDLHAGLPFVLLGDSGQHDAEIYRAVVERYPGRIRAIYIRDVAVEARDRIVVEIARGLEEVDLVLVENTLEAAEHAVGLGLVTPERLEEIARAAERDAAG